MIPVKNIYYMLAYAFSALQSQGYRTLAMEEFDNAYDLLCAILTKGILTQAKRGFIKSYTEIIEETKSPKGKIEVSTSIKRNSHLTKKLSCNYDEFTTNTYLNQILVTAGILLLKTDANPSRKKALKRALEYLKGVEPLNPNIINWKHNYNRQNANYEMLISVCRLIIQNCIASKTGTPTIKVEDFNEKSMAHLYEKFLLEYFKKEHSDKVDVSSPLIPWAIVEEESSFLPTMRTDVVLRSKTSSENVTLIIDAKYYSKAFQEHFGVRTLHSGNLYQIFTYVKNEEFRLSTSAAQNTVSGMLLYARTDEDIFLNERHIIDGNNISALSLDLNVDFPYIKEQLDNIVHEYFR